MSHSNFGIVGVATAAATGATVNAALNVSHALKVSKIQEGFQRQLKDDQTKINYIKNLVLRLQSIGTRLSYRPNLYPGSREFNALLKQALINEMIYKGNCNADIFVPMGPDDKLGEPRQIMGKFSRSGHVVTTMLPADTGPIWATACKNAEDVFRTARIKKLRGTRKHSVLKAQQADIGTLNLFLKFGAGLFTLVLLILTIKTQRKRIKHQRGTSQ